MAKVEAGDKSKAEIDPSKIKTVLFLKPEKATSHQDWLQSDPSRISTVWPKDPKPSEATVDQGAEEKLEFDGKFRQILAE